MGGRIPWAGRKPVRAPLGPPSASGPKKKNPRRHGAHWEKVLHAQHLAYLRKQTADIEKIPTPIKQLTTPAPGRGGRLVFTACHEPRRHVDFEGGVCGRFIRLEAKAQISDGRIALKRVGENQSGSLKRCDAMGGFAAVLVLHPSGMYLVPWCNWRPVQKGSRQLVSLSQADLALRGAQFGDAHTAQLVLMGRSTAADWLKVARQREWIS